MDCEARELLEHLRGAALGARHRLVARADELLEVRLALHARVLVDRHELECTVACSGGVDGTDARGADRPARAPRPAHEEGLWIASRDPQTWRWLSVVQPQTREEWHAFVAQALAAAAAGTELPLVTIRDEEVVGSTRFLALRPEHRSVEIGWTWLHPAVWGTGANVEAKFLQLRHAFEAWGCRRVEWKTDAGTSARVVRSRRSVRPSRASTAHHMLVRDGENRDSAWYSVTDDDWPSVRDAIEARLAQS